VATELLRLIGSHDMMPSSDELRIGPIAAFDDRDGLVAGTAHRQSAGNPVVRHLVPQALAPFGGTAVQAICFLFEVFRHAEPRLPNRRVSGSFGEFAIPGGELPQFLCFPHRPGPSEHLAQYGHHVRAK
jgi:hypothetical protein